MDDWATRGLRSTRDARGVVRVSLERSAVHNAFDEATITDLSAAFNRLSADQSVRVVVIAAAGRTFCAGADVQWMRRAANNELDANIEDARQFSAMMIAIDQCKKPVVARVQGAAYGGGVGLICASDIAIASDHARFVVSEAKLGILPSVIGPYLVNAVGQRQARRLALSATEISAAEALAMGMIHRVVPDEMLDAAVEQCVAELLRCGPGAQRAIKQLFGQLPGGPISEEVQSLTVSTIAHVRAGREAREGFAAFMSKRPAAWET